MKNHEKRSVFEGLHQSSKRDWNHAKNETVDRNKKCLNFNLWQLGRMWLDRPQKWDTWTNLGTSIFLTTNLVLDFAFCLNKEQFGLIWPTTPQRWQVGTQPNFLCTLTEGLDIGLETSMSTSELLSLSSLAK